MHSKLLSILPTWSDEDRIAYIMSRNPDTSILYTREDRTPLYLETKHERYISSESWSMTPEELWRFRVENGTQYSYTSPSSFALSVFRKLHSKAWYFMDGYSEPNDYRLRLCHEALYGGRCEVFYFGDVFGSKYDINSSYPYHALSMLFPDTRKLVYIDTPDFQHIIDFDGVSVVEYSQQSDIPLLPVRYHGRTIYPIASHCTGTYTHNELRYGLKHGHIEIHRIIKQYAAPSTVDAFSGFMEYCYRKRLETGQKIWKVIANSLIGRLSVLPSPLLHFTVSPLKHIEWSMMPKKLRYPVGSNDYLRLQGEEVASRTWCNPLWASMILSSARCTLYDCLDYSKHVYVDTDCIISRTTEALSVGGNIGQWKVETGRYTIRGTQCYIDASGNLVMRGVSKHHRSLDSFFGSKHTNERYLLSTGRTAPYVVKDYTP